MQRDDGRLLPHQGAHARERGLGQGQIDGCLGASREEAAAASGGDPHDAHVGFVGIGGRSEAVPRRHRGVDAPDIHADALLQGQQVGREGGGPFDCLVKIEASFAKAVCKPDPEKGGSRAGWPSSDECSTGRLVATRVVGMAPAPPAPAASAPRADSVLPDLQGEGEGPDATSTLRDGDAELDGVAAGAGVEGWGGYSAPSASRRMTVHRALTSARSVGRAPTLTRTIHRPSSVAGVR